MVNYPFFYPTFEKSINKEIFDDFGTYSDSSRFFQYKITPLFFDAFQKS